MSSELNKNYAAPCGAMGAVVRALNEKVIENAEGTVTVHGATRGDNENLFPIKVTASETAAEQIRVELKKAKAKEMPGIKIWVMGPAEVDFATSKVGDQRVLELHIGADLVRPAHPLDNVEPLQNSGVFFGSPSIAKREGDNGTYYQGSVEFPHLTTELEDSNAAPAEIKLAGTSAESLFASNGSNLMLSGRLSRQTGEMAGNKYDHLSLSVNTAAEVRMFGTSRRPPKSTASNTVVTADYETGFDSDPADQEAARAQFASMDF